VPYRPGSHINDEQGFTLIELLVVILIIGILAAVAISSLLSQKSKAYDASAKTLVSTAQATVETYAIDHNGSYANASKAEIHNYEKTIPIEQAKANGGAWLSAASGEADSYSVTATAANTEDQFTITRNAAGEVQHTCDSPNTKTGCSGVETGSW